MDKIGDTSKADALMKEAEKKYKGINLRITAPSYFRWIPQVYDSQG